MAGETKILVKTVGKAFVSIHGKGYVQRVLIQQGRRGEVSETVPVSQLKVEEGKVYLVRPGK